MNLICGEMLEGDDHHVSHVIRLEKDSDGGRIALEQVHVFFGRDATANAFRGP